MDKWGKHTKFWLDIDNVKQFSRQRNTKDNNNETGLKVVERMKTELSWRRIGKITHSSLSISKVGGGVYLIRFQGQLRNFTGFIIRTVTFLFFFSDVKQELAFKLVVIPHRKYICTLTVSFSGKRLPKSTYIQTFQQTSFPVELEAYQICVYVSAFLVPRQVNKLCDITETVKLFIIYDFNCQ
jgi:hypothetical protein